MKASKIQIGQKVQGKNGQGVITKIITKSTGYVEVDYNGTIKKEMAFNLTDENGESLKAKPASNTAVKLREKLSITDNSPASWMNADGTKNWDKYNDFLEEREAAKRAAHSTFY